MTYQSFFFLPVFGKTTKVTQKDLCVLLMPQRPRPLGGLCSPLGLGSTHLSRSGSSRLSFWPFLGRTAFFGLPFPFGKRFIPNRVQVPSGPGERKKEKEKDCIKGWLTNPPVLYCIGAYGTCTSEGGLSHWYYGVSKPLLVKVCSGVLISLYYHPTMLESSCCKMAVLCRWEVLSQILGGVSSFWCSPYNDPLWPSSSQSINLPTGHRACWDDLMNIIQYDTVFFRACSGRIGTVPYRV